MDTKAVIEHWYKKLRFPDRLGGAFYRALNSIPVPEDVTLESYDLGSKDGARNLLTFLYLCEETHARAAALGIPENVITDTLGDIQLYVDFAVDEEMVDAAFGIVSVGHHPIAEVGGAAALEYCRFCKARRRQRKRQNKAEQAYEQAADLHGKASFVSVAGAVCARLPDAPTLSGLQPHFLSRGGGFVQRVEDAYHVYALQGHVIGLRAVQNDGSEMLETARVAASHLAGVGL